MTLEETLAALMGEMAELRAAFAQQQKEISALREVVSQRQSAPSQAPASLALAAAHPEAVAADPQQARRKGTSRRGLLRTAAAGAAAATVATVALGATQEAHAATGGNLILGQTNDANLTTTLQPTSGSVPSAVLSIVNNTSGPYRALQTVSSGGYGVFAYDSNAGYAVYGTARYGGYGVFGYSGGGPGYGVTGMSDHIDLAAVGAGRIWQTPQQQVGAPTSGAYNAGESIRDANGDLWLCIMAGTPGMWAKVAHLAPGATSGGATTYLDKPIRLLDTRAGYTDALFHPGAPYTSANPYPLQVAGDVYNGVTVPTGLAGALGNVTVVNPAGGGYIALVPHGVGFTGTANLAYSAGQVASNFFNVGVASGQLDIIIGGAATDVIIDLFAIVA